MQHDTVITSMNSYFLGDGIGVTGSLDNIEEVTINGIALPVNGYLDIGLIDSMMDMLLESLGAVVVAVIYILDKGRHPLFTARSEYAEIT